MWLQLTKYYKAATASIGKYLERNEENLTKTVVQTVRALLERTF